MIVVGIDIGLTGGIVALRDGTEVVYQSVMPVVSSTYDDSAIVSLAASFRRMAEVEPLCVAIERVWGIPRTSARACFSLGEGVGIWRGVLAALGVPYEVVSPKTWQGAMLRGVDGNTTKEKSLLAASRILPCLDLRRNGRGQPRESGISDAALIAVWATRRAKGA